MINKKVNAFTLAEVLITLVIIGVVAAMTIPNVIQHYKKQEYSARVKKFYSTMQQVVQKADAVGKSWRDFDDNISNFQNSNYLNFLNGYVLPYLQYTKRDNQIVYLTDGSYFKISLEPYPFPCVHFDYDVNGDKLPNVSGSDIFEFEYCSSWYSGEKLKFGPYQYTNSMIKTYNTREKVKDACASSSGGGHCTVLLVKYDNWEFKNDYPKRL